ncbi:MAG: hypothetical protein BM485_01530 [Desulfobulbaceae bacterium DB1]|nr:MAG: hypothetical protein BM485_01530 [Desulfobulbaceae bacterium DB1]
MSKKLDEIPTVSPSNTKKEILEAYNQLVEKFDNRAEEELQPEKEKEVRRIREVTVVAEELAGVKVSEAIGSIKTGISTALTDIAARIEEQTERYRKTKEAVAAKEKELAEIFEIEKSAYSLAALLEAQKQKKTAFEEEMATRREELESSIKHDRATWEQKQAEAVARVKEQQEQLEKARRREQEEYDYKLMREREQKTNALQDEINLLEKELHLKKEEFEKKVADREAYLKEREAVVTQQEKRIVALDIQVEKFPRELEEAIKKTVKETTERLTAAYTKNEELLRNTLEGEKNVLTTRIQSLEQTAVDQKKQIDLLASQLDKAYGKVQDIAIKAVSSPRERYYNESPPKGTAQNDGK